MTGPRPGTALAEDDDAFEGPLFDAFAAVAARQPDHLAVDDGDTRLSYGELRDRAFALGARIAALVPADGLVGVAVPTGVLVPVAWLACLAARRPFLPLDTRLPPARNQAIIAEAGLAAAIVLTMADHAAWLPAALPRIAMTAAPGLAPTPLPAGRPPAAVGMVVFTSGSTGRPKGIALHERSPLRNAKTYAVSCDLGPADALLSLHLPSTDAGMRDVFAALLCGASLHLTDLQRDGFARVLTRLRDGGITMCTTVPVVVRALLAMDGADAAFRRLRILRLSGQAVTGSDIVALARVLAPAARVMVSFGMTETGRTLTQRLIDPRAPVETGRVATGMPAPGQTLSVEGADGNPVRPGEVGTLVIRGSDIALGYWVAGRLDPTAFPADPSVPGVRCFRSGDMVRLRSDGMMVPIGRVDRQVKINGVRVEPGDAEATLRGLQGVADAAVLALDDGRATALVAFIVPARGESLARNPAQQARRVRSALAALLPPQLVPAHIHVVSAIPLLPSLKPDLAALQALAATESARGVFARAWPGCTALRPDRLPRGVAFRGMVRQYCASVTVALPPANRSIRCPAVVAAALAGWGGCQRCCPATQ